MRRGATVIVAGFLALAVAGCSAPATEPVEAGITFETVLEAPLGDGVYELGESPGGPWQTPNAYAVTKDSVIILDSVKDRVVEYRDGAIARIVPVDGLREGYSIAVGDDGDWYIYDCGYPSVIRLSPSGRVVAEWPFPEDIKMKGVPRLKQGKNREVVLALGSQCEYGLGRPLSGPYEGLTFPNHPYRYKVKRVDGHTLAICEGDRERWHLHTESWHASALPLGFDRGGRLIVWLLDWVTEREVTLFALGPGRGMTRCVVSMPHFASSPDPAFCVGGDGELYHLGYTKEKAVLQRLHFKASR